MLIINENFFSQIILAGIGLIKTALVIVYKWLEQKVCF